MGNVAKAEVSANALVVTSSFEEDAHLGFDGMNQDDLALPFLRLLTATSPEVGEVDGAMPGMVYNTVTGQLYDGKKGLLVIPCAYVRQYIEWAPRGKGPGAPINIYPSTSDILTKTHRKPGDSKDYLDNGNYVEATATHFVMLVHEGVGEPALIAMKSTQLKKSRRWNSMMQAAKMIGKNGPFTPPMYSHLYKLTTVPESNDKGKWFGWEIEALGPITDRALYMMARAFAESVNTGKVQVKHDFDAEDLEPSRADPF